MTTPRKYRPLTARQSEMLFTIIGYIEEHAMPPTRRELGDRMGIRSVNGVNDHLVALERKGYIERLPDVTTDHKSRAAAVMLRGDPVVIQQLVAEALAAREA